MQYVCCPKCCTGSTKWILKIKKYNNKVRRICVNMKVVCSYDKAMTKQYSVFNIRHIVGHEHKRPTLLIPLKEKGGRSVFVCLSSFLWTHYRGRTRASSFQIYRITVLCKSSCALRGTSQLESCNLWQMPVPALKTTLPACARFTAQPALSYSSRFTRSRPRRAKTFPRKRPPTAAFPGRLIKTKQWAAKSRGLVTDWCVIPANLWSDSELL